VVRWRRFGEAAERDLREAIGIVLENHMARVRNGSAFASLERPDHAFRAFGRHKIGISGAYDEGGTRDRRQGSPGSLRRVRCAKSNCDG
jgi:hypothetical protein